MILALDSASNRTGWCLMDSAGRFSTGTMCLRAFRDDIGGLLAAHRSWLRGMIRAHDVEIVGFEAPSDVRGNSIRTKRQLFSICGLIELVCRDNDVPVVECNNNTLKKLIYGSGGKKPKPAEGLPLARRWGFDPQTMDEADSCGVMLMILQHRHPDRFEGLLRTQAASRVAAGEAML